jgi:hypothetical protein
VTGTLGSYQCGASTPCCILLLLQQWQPALTAGLCCLQQDVALLRYPNCNSMHRLGGRRLAISTCNMQVQVTHTQKDDCQVMPSE